MNTVLENPVITSICACGMHINLALIYQMKYMDCVLNLLFQLLLTNPVQAKTYLRTSNILFWYLERDENIIIICCYMLYHVLGFYLSV